MNDTHCKISAATLARTAALALALTNQVLSACGKPMLPIESATVEQLVTTGLTVTAALTWCAAGLTSGTLPRRGRRCRPECRTPEIRLRPARQPAALRT